jgi:uncharacterized membrane protein YgcG
VRSRELLYVALHVSPRVPPDDASPECRPGRETGSRLSYRFHVSITTLIRTTSASRLRAGVRAGIIAATASVPLLAASSALAASHPYDGEDSGPGLSVLQTLGIYLGIPLGLFLLIAFLVSLPGWVRGDRNRREVGWVGQNGSAAPNAGASGSSASSAGSSAPQSVSAGKGSGTGGASGSW